MITTDNTLEDDDYMQRKKIRDAWNEAENADLTSLGRAIKQDSRACDMNVKKLQGHWSYSRGHLNPPIHMGYNCKWLAIESKDKIAYLATRCIEQDPVTKNLHCIERLYLDVCPKADLPNLANEFDSTYADSFSDRYDGAIFEFMEPMFSSCVLPYSLPLTREQKSEVVDIVLNKMR